MSPAQDELDTALASVEWKTTESILVANVDGKVHTSAEDWTTLLSRQLTSPVEFLDATLALPESVTHSIEMAPPGVLTGLTKRIRTFETQYSPSTLKELQEMQL
jgi:malonyl CoA-acyl carrier protein transacylase